MANARYKLSDGVQDAFQFCLTDPATKEELVYEMKYPSPADLEPTKELNERSEELKAKMNDENATDDQKRAWQEEIDKLAEEQKDVMLNLVSPVDHKTPIKEVLDRVNVRVLNNFNKMITKEFER